MTVPVWLTVALLVTAPPADTTVQVRRGESLLVQNFTGSVVVRAWDRDVLEVRGTDGDRSDVGVVRRGARVAVVPSERKRGDRDIEVLIRAPLWMALEISGRELDVGVYGTRGGVDVRNVEGDITVHDTRGDVRLGTVDGEIDVRGARGNVTAHSRGDDVVVLDAVGDLDVESGSGDLRLEGIDAERIRAETVDGDIRFDGTIRPGGVYSFSVHDGDAILAIPAGAGVDVSVATFDGEFSSDFPVTLQRYNGGRRFEFTLGRGGARMDVQVFDGQIRLQERR